MNITHIWLAKQASKQTHRQAQQTRQQAHHQQRGQAISTATTRQKDRGATKTIFFASNTDVGQTVTITIFPSVLQPAGRAFWRNTERIKEVEESILFNIEAKYSILPLYRTKYLCAV